MALSGGGNPNPENNAGCDDERPNECPFCHEALFSVARHLRHNKCEAQP